ncbi:putative c6 transcription factor [Phaeomoniella chlamydospora]|uniref:Putative c6 transcription factor n=1 Tax=Phaeomoniella chlamydospora TaxID=158046 RepID=A0A0G2H8S5_PHACM|nr:putative c6 transcription factor [Phaeomoniella chlamydospora]
MNSPPGGKKRSYRETEVESSVRPSTEAHQEKLSQQASPPLTSAAAASAFRNVSACNRCRLRKNRCDQRLPACTACEKAKQKCVGYDPITKREIPRSYVYYLESRVAYFESLLVANDISFKPPEAFDPEIALDDGNLASPAEEKALQSTDRIKVESPAEKQIGKQPGFDETRDDAEKLNKLVSNIGMVSVQGASDPRYLGSTSGISFARVVFAAVKSSVSGSSSEKAGIRPSKPNPNIAAAGGSSMRDSFFGLQTKPTIKQAAFPDRQLGEKLVRLYFEHANPQIPILHRGDFMDLFQRAYALDNRSRTSRELYLLNIVFAIGAGIIWGSSDPEPSATQNGGQQGGISPQAKRAKLASQQQQPEEYHASAIIHLESFLGSSSAADRPEGFGGGLEELQAVLLLASFALLRPVAPGLWYIIGVAVRLAVDLGLHYEDGSGIEVEKGQEIKTATSQDITMGATNDMSRRRSVLDTQEKGRREWVRDLRRRLWWCVYSLDRLVSTCVGRPFGITDQVITTEFPSLLDDQYITRAGLLRQNGESQTSYKHISVHYFRLRLLQSEILQVLQHQQAQQARLDGTNSKNEYMHTKLPSPFLVKFESFRSWRRDIDRRLWEWKESAPYQEETGVQFSPHFLELNYWQAVIMLYRNSLTVPAPLASELSPTEDVASPSLASVEEREDEDDVFLKVAEAGQKVLRLYRQLHRVRLVNYTFLATHHLFMAGISFLYAVWHSPVTLDDVDFTVLAATSVLGDLMEKCPPAEACKDAFERMSKATVQMCLSTTGFGAQADQQRNRPSGPSRTSFTGSLSENQSYTDVSSRSQARTQASADRQIQRSRRPPPKFDMNLRELFPEDTAQNLPLTSSALQSFNINNPSFRFPQSRSQQSQKTDVKFPPPSGLSSVNHSLNTRDSPNMSTQANSQGQQSSSLPSHPLQSYPFTHNHVYNQPTFSAPNTSNAGQIADFVTLGDMEFDLSNPTNDLFGTDANNLEDFGLGMDFAGFTSGAGGTGHDWSDGAGGVDLFDGFFFGGNGAGGGGF